MRFFGVSAKVCLKIDFQTCELTVKSLSMPNNPFLSACFCILPKNSPWVYWSFYTFKNALGLSHSPRSPRNLTPASTIICPSSPSATLNLSSGLGAGPSMLSPSGVNPLPWQGHLNFPSAASQLGVQPRWVHFASITYNLSTSLTIHILNCFLNLSLTPDVYWKGYPILYRVGGSKIVLGKKNLIVAPNTVVKNAPIKPPTQ